MTYDEFIWGIIDKRGLRGTEEGKYKERHHIIPRCLGGTDAENNLIDLYADEHLMAHKLLALENPQNSGLVNGYWLMCNTQCGEFCTPEEYAQIKETYSKLCSARMKEEFKNDAEKSRKFGQINKGKHFYNDGEINVMGYTCPEGFVKGRLLTKAQKEHLDKMHEACKGKPTWNSGKTNVYSEETKKKMGAKNLGRKMPEEHKQKLISINTGNTYNLGRKLSDEHKQKISKANKGKNVGAKNGMYGKIPWNKKKDS